jgi:heme/copper-type cytochrome/quinol oxidase subunit 2
VLCCVANTRAAVSLSNTKPHAGIHIINIIVVDIIVIIIVVIVIIIIVIIVIIIIESIRRGASRIAKAKKTTSTGIYQHSYMHYHHQRRADIIIAPIR